MQPRQSLARSEPDTRGAGSRILPESESRALALRVVSRATNAAPVDTADHFLIRRAAASTPDLSDPRERTTVSRLLEMCAHGPSGGTALTDGLVEWAGLLESRSLLDAASRVLDLGRSVAPTDAEMALHAARVARKDGRTLDARALYDEVATLDGDDGGLAAMAAVGRALTDEDPVPALSAALRRAVSSGAFEAAAVAQEGRARARRAAGDRTGALRDYLAAAARYTDPIDRGRIGHEVADLLTAAGDVAGARVALLETERLGHPEQVAFARARLRLIALAQGDEVGARRYGQGQGHTSSLVSLGPRGAGSRRPTQRRRTAGPADRMLRRGLGRISGVGRRG